MPKERGAQANAEDDEGGDEDAIVPLDALGQASHSGRLLVGRPE
jgi:hypothetical protein